MPILQSRIKDLIDSGRAIANAYHGAMSELKLAAIALSKGDIRGEEFYAAVCKVYLNSELLTAKAEGVLIAEELHYRLTSRRNIATAKYMAKRRAGQAGRAGQASPGRGDNEALRSHSQPSAHV